MTPAHAPTSQSSAYKYVGRSIARLDGAAKVRGLAKYIDDLQMPGILFGKTVRSTIARGAIRKLEFGGNFNWDEFVIATADDIPGENCVQVIFREQPLLADKRILHKEEPILLIAHSDRQLVECAAAAIHIEYDEEPGVFEIGKGPVQKEYLFTEGDVEAEFAASDRIVEATYRTGSQEHVYIETNGVIAWWDERGVTVRGSMQCPYYVHKAMQQVFPLEDHQIDIIQDTTGGGFGGKEEYPSIIAMHAALLAKKAGRPVKLIYDRMEDMLATTKRHPSESTVRAGVMADGTLRALDFDYRQDGGAYLTLSPVVLSRAVLHSFGAYQWPAARIRGRSFMTNSPPYGAFRGFGAPQSLFALECHITRIARELGMDPAELRRKNFLHRGDKLPTGQVLKAEPNLDAILDRALELSNYKEKVASFAEANRKINLFPGTVTDKSTDEGVCATSQSCSTDALVCAAPDKIVSSIVAQTGASVPHEKVTQKFLSVPDSSTQTATTAQTGISVLRSNRRLKGIGVSTFMHGAGFTGSGEVYLASRVALATWPDGKVELLTANTDIGQGTETIFPQIVAEALGIGIGDAIFHQPDTRIVPNSGPTVASRTTMVVGGLFQRAARQLREKLNGSSVAAYHAEHGMTRIEVEYEPPPGIKWDDQHYKGEAYGAYSWCCDVCEVAVDPVTAEIKVDEVVSVVDIGQVINPVLAIGQVEGGIAQAVGWATCENVKLKDGVIANPHLMNYIIPTTMDIPQIVVEFMPNPYEFGAFGSKGVGELPMDGPAPAICDAINMATGKDFRHVPIQPEDVL